MPPPPQSISQFLMPYPVVVYLKSKPSRDGLNKYISLQYKNNENTYSWGGGVWVIQTKLNMGLDKHTVEK